MVDPARTTTSNVNWPGAQRGHHQTPPLIGRDRLIVAPATEGHEVLEIVV